MELLNALGKYRKLEEAQQNRALFRDILRGFVVLLSPFAPHFAEEWNERMGNSSTVFQNDWPKFDACFLQLDEDEIELAVMIYGKFRGRIQVPAC